MTQQNPKKLIGIVLVVVVILIGAYILWARNSKVETKNNNQMSEQNKNQNAGASTSPSGDINSGTGAKNLGSTEANQGASAQDSSQDSPEEKRSSEKPDENYRQQVIAYINQNLNKLAPSPANDKWDVPTFYFIGNSNVYVELYAVDTDLAGFKLLYKVNKNGNEISLTELARYKEGEEDWILSQGQDDFDNYVMEEYDYNEKSKKWEKTDEFTDETTVDNSGLGNDNGDISNQGGIVE